MIVVGKEVSWIFPINREDGESQKLYGALWSKSQAGSFTVSGNLDLDGKELKVVGLLLQEIKKRK